MLIYLITVAGVDANAPDNSQQPTATITNRKADAGGRLGIIQLKVVFFFVFGTH